MSFSCYKALVRLAQNSSNTERNVVGVRSYCRKLIFSSESPQTLNIKPKIAESKEPKREQALPSRRNRKIYRFEKDLSYDKARSQNESIHDQKKPKILADQEEYKNFDVQKFEENQAGRIFKLSNRTGLESMDLPQVQTERIDSQMKNSNEPLSRYKIMHTSEGAVKYDLSADEFDMNAFVEKFNSTLPGPLDNCEEDISDLGPNFVPTFNFAAYADKSELIQQFVKLGVKLWKVERNQDHMRALLTVDMEKELPEYIRFLHDCGVPADSLGDVITESPMILKEDLDDMKTRIRYLRAHDFAVESIARIVTKNPKWLLWATKCIDERLGHFQNEFKLTGSEVRFLATKQAKLITYNFKHIHENTFAVREEMGFNNREMKVLLLAKPRIWMNNRKKIVDTFDYLHNTMKLSHLTIASNPGILTCRKTRVKDRHEFLMELKKVQYDPTQPGYISPSSIVFGSDAEFCRDIAKTALETYNLFLKTR